MRGAVSISKFKLPSRAFRIEVDRVRETSEPSHLLVQVTLCEERKVREHELIETRGGSDEYRACVNISMEEVREGLKCDCVKRTKLLVKGRDSCG